MLQSVLPFLSRSNRAARLITCAAVAVAAASCTDKSFVGVSQSTNASLGVVVGIGDVQDGEVTGVRIQVTYQANAQTFSLYDDEIPFTLDQPSRDLPIQLDIGPCLGALGSNGELATSCPVTVIVDILSGTRVLARDQLPPMVLTPGGTTTTSALGARTASALQLTHNGQAVPNPLVLLIGNTADISSAVLDFAGAPIGGRVVSWRTGNASIATVDAEGVITGIDEGSATIIASTGTGAALLEMSVNVQVMRRPVTTITVTPNPVSMIVGGTQSLAIEARDDLNNIVQAPPVTWESLNQAVATVSAAGVVTGIATGSATIRARTTVDTEITGTTTVNVAAGARLYGQVRNAQTNQSMSGATLRATRLGDGAQFLRTTGADGSYNFESLPVGTYNVLVEQTGFRTQSILNLVLQATQATNATRIDVDLPPLTHNQPFGGIAGRITQANGSPIAGATVSLYGGEQTNGVFRATTTGPDGSYSFAGIVLEDSDGFPLTSLTVIAEFSGLDPNFRTIPVPADRVVPNVDLSLSVSGPVTTFFFDGFETLTNWVATGMWHRTGLTGITNNAFPTYVQLAPDDASNGALPAPRTGAFAYWFGSSQPTGVPRGNFLGQHVGPEEDSPLSGGTSIEPVAGSLTSPFFLIPENVSRATLRFDAWFEIESVNPNQSGFDIMEVSLRRFGDNFPFTLHRLNPFVSPTLPNRNAIPYTSGGFNRAPIWRTVEVDLTEYIGQQVQVVFSFNSVDGLFNGFRGWIVDNVSVSDRVPSIPGPPSSMKVRTNETTPPPRRRGR